MEISTVGQCVLELILNSLDAKTTGVAVRFHNEEKRIQVVDCGEGIPPDVLTRIGETEKKNGSDSKILGYNHSSRGKSLKQILELSQICIITSRHEGSTETYEKVFRTGDTPIFLKGNRPAKGSSVTIYGFQGSGWDSASNAIYFAIASLALMYTNVSFTLHDQVTGELVTGIHKPHEPYHILNSICEQSLSLETTWDLNSGKASRFQISGYVGYLKQKSIAVHHIFINRRPMKCHQIEKFIYETMSSLRVQLQIPSAGDVYFLIYIKCSFSEFILSSYEGRTFAVFHYCQKILNNIKACISNAITVDYNKVIKAERSKVQETVFKLSRNYESADETHLEKKNKIKIEKCNRKEISKIFNQRLEEKVKATKVSILPINQKLNFEKQLENKIPETTHISIFPNNHKNVFRKEMKDKKTKAKQVLFLKKNYEEIFGELIKEQKAKAKQISFLKKNHEKIFGKLLEEQKTKTKHVSFFEKKYKDIFEKSLKDQNTKEKQISVLKTNHEHILGEQLKDKKTTAKPISIFKKTHKNMFGKELDENNVKAKQVSGFKSCSKTRFLNSRELQKLNSCRAVVNRLRKHERLSIEDDLELLNKGFLKSLTSMKNRILKKQIKTQISDTEERNQRKQERKLPSNKEETYQLTQKNMYHSNQKEAHQERQDATDQRIQKESNQLEIQVNKAIRDFGKSQLQFFKENQNVDIRKSQNFGSQTKPADSTKAVENHFVAGEKVLELVNLNVSAQKIDPKPCSQLSEWSDWNYNWPISKEAFQPPESKKVDCHRLYRFLPPILNPMLRFGKTNIISEANIQNDSENVYSTDFNPEIKPDHVISRYQNLNVRPCVVVPHSNEFKLNRKSLYSIQILRQINLEFIAALTIQDNKTLLLMIDQHAADERIRYEDLLQNYRIDATKQYFSVGLYQSILITDIEPKKCELLLSNEKLLSRFGIRLKSDSHGNLTVMNIPRCFLKKKSFDNDFKMFCSVRNLLLEIIENLESTNSASILPRSIHKAIASEACRGAVKFGDPLTIDQCNLLIQSLRETNAPNRCAHGRPSIIPLLDVTDLKKKQTKNFQGKLNFASLKKIIIKNK